MARHAAGRAGVRLPSSPCPSAHPPLNDYLRYEFEWGYLPNAEAGETIRVLDLSEVRRPDELIEQDFWILDDAHVLMMIYNEAGEFVGGEIPDDVESYRRARDAALAVSEDVGDWWARHPEEHRANRDVIV